MASSDPFREVQVERVQPLGPTMQRVTFEPRDRTALPAERPHGGHCRLRFPGRDASAPPHPRAYTYRRWHADGRFDVDFVVHAGDGPAARWLRQVRPGACIGWRHGGPPKICLAAPAPEPTILIADLSGLPVMAALIEQAHPTRQVSLILTVCPDAAPDPAPRAAPASTTCPLRTTSSSTCCGMQPSPARASSPPAKRHRCAATAGCCWMSSPCPALRSSLRATGKPASRPKTLTRQSAGRTGSGMGLPAG